jgi:integrase/recombinase XerC
LGSIANATREGATVSSLVTQQPDWLAEHIEDEDLIRDLLADKRSRNTRRAYEKDLGYFFEFLTGKKPTPILVAQFLGLRRADAIKVVLRYKAQLLERGLKEATINRRLAAIRSLTAYARKLDKCAFTLEEVKGERCATYRDTTGVSVEEFKAMLAIPDRATLKGKRDYALLRLFWSNALRRSEALVRVEDFDAGAMTLNIVGKGRGTQVERVELPPTTVDAIQEWLIARGNVAKDDALFIALNNAHYGHPLTADGVYGIVRAIASQAGIKKIFSPHRIRHSSLTAALDATNGDVRRVQKLSRHRKADTLLIYDDNRKNAQKEMSGIVSDLV